MIRALPSLSLMTRRVMLLSLALSPLASACSDPPEETPADALCDATTTRFHAEGALRGEESAPGAVEVSQTTVLGSSSGDELVVGASDPVLGQMLLRLRTSDEGQVLLDELTRAVTSAPLTLKVVDVSAGGTMPGQRASLASFSCLLAQGEICAQVVLDRDEDGFVTDADAVFNASGGTVTIRAIANKGSELVLGWDLQVGQDVVAMAGAPGSVAGCLDARIVPEGAGYRVK